eukprot:5246355-Pleurochrysis_carterae.AAC.1
MPSSRAASASCPAVQRHHYRNQKAIEPCSLRFMRRRPRACPSLSVGSDHSTSLSSRRSPSTARRSIRAGRLTACSCERAQWQL